MKLEDWPSAIQRQIAAIKPEVSRTLDKIGEAIEKAAKEKIGHYQPGWAPLAPATVRDKEAKGFAPPDNPLLREGILRDSTEHEMRGSMVVVVDSEDPDAAYQEFGTARGIPPRPFIGSAMFEAKPTIQRMIGLALRRALMKA